MSGRDIKSKLSYKEFLQLCDEDTLAEWVDGRIEYYSPASDRHQNLVGWLSSILRMYVENKNLGIIRIAPFQMRLKKVRSGREPDILFISNKNLANLNETYLDAAADLVIEITSEESRMRDKKIKFNEYEKAGVKEYWLIDPYDKVANFYVLQKGKYKKVEPNEKEGKYYSKIVRGFWIKPEWLFKELLPSPIRILGEIVNVDKKLIEAFEQALQK